MKSNSKQENPYFFITSGHFGINNSSSLLIRFEDLTPVIINNSIVLIGEGRFSKVYLYKHKLTNLYYALKQISKQKVIESGHTIEIIKNEIKIHSLLNHENIVQFFQVKEDLYFVNLLLEYCGNGTLYNSINVNGLDEFVIHKYFSQVVNAVYFLHKNNLVHRDIKPENILIQKNKIKLCDFGWCCLESNIKKNDFCGTFEYMAPEIIKEMPYGKPVDIWALGILLYEMYYGFSPFRSINENNNEVIDNIMKKKLIFSNNKNIPNDMKDLICHMLEYDIKKRYDINQVISHCWLQKYKNNENKRNIKIIKLSTNKTNNQYLNHTNSDNRRRNIDKNIDVDDGENYKILKNETLKVTPIKKITQKSSSTLKVSVNNKKTDTLNKSLKISKSKKNISVKKLTNNKSHNKNSNDIISGSLNPNYNYSYIKPINPNISNDKKNNKELNKTLILPLGTNDFKPTVKKKPTLSNLNFFNSRNSIYDERANLYRYNISSPGYEILNMYNFQKMQQNKNYFFNGNYFQNKQNYITQDKIKIPNNYNPVYSFYYN